MLIRSPLKAILISAALTVFPQLAQAYTVTTLSGSSAIDPSKPTRLFVIGYSDNLGNNFFISAMGRARRYRELYPQDQIVFFGPTEKSVSYYASVLPGMGFKILENTPEKLLNTTLLARLSKFKQIRTLDIVSHSSAHHGAGLEKDTGSQKRFGAKLAGIGKLKANFLPGAYSIFHGCNSGFVQAPALAKLWDIPVAGSLSSTNFQELFNDGEFYHHDAGLYPAELGRPSFNDQSFDARVKCSQAGCMRLKADPHPYTGTWGKFSVGLGFYKFFYSPSDGNKARLFPIMAESLFSYMNVKPLSAKVTREEFKTALQDFLCPSPKYAAKRAECFEKLTAYETDRSIIYPGGGMIRGRSVHCELSGCKVVVRCDDSATNCVMTSPEDAKPTTILREYQHYLDGFDALTAANASATSSTN